MVQPLCFRGSILVGQFLPSKIAWVKKKMTIRISIPFEALNRPGVAKALADLLLGIGGHTAEIPVQAAAPEAKPAPAAPAPKTLPKPTQEPAPAAVQAAPPPAAPAPVQAPPVQAPPVQAAPEAAEPAEEPAVPASGVSLERELKSLRLDDRWTERLQTLPDPSRRFLVLLKKRGTLTMEDAITLLDLASPKAMGGLTGAMTRWARWRGVELPFDTRRDEQGGRYWVWTHRV